MLKFGWLFGRPVSDAADIEGNAQHSFATATTYAKGTNDSGLLDEGLYDVWASADTYIAVAGDPTGLTTSTGYLLRSGNTFPLVVRQGSRIGGIVSAGTGTVFYHKVG